MTAKLTKSLFNHGNRKMKIVYYGSGETTQISGDWRDWLVQLGYNRVPEFPPGGELALALTKNKDKACFAIYHPPVGKVEVECIYVGIPTEEEAERLLDICVQMIKGPLSLLSAGIDALQQHRYPSA